MVLISQTLNRQVVLYARNDLQKFPCHSVPYIFDSLSRLSPSLNQLQTNRSLAVAKEQTLTRDNGVVPGFVVEHWQS